MSETTPFPDTYYPTERNVFNVIIREDVTVMDGSTKLTKQYWDSFWYDPANINRKLNNGKQGQCNLGFYDDFLKRAAERGYKVNVIADYRKK